LIIHLDLDCYFASAERTLDRSLLGKPIAVGGRSNLSLFDKKQSSTKMYNPNSGAFVAPVFHNSKRKTFEEFFVDKGDKNQPDKIRGIITTASYEARAFGVKSAMSVNEALQYCPHLQVVPPNYLLYHDLSHQLSEYLKVKIPAIEQFSIDEFFGDVGGWIDDEDVYDFALEVQQEILEKFDLPISIGISEAKWIAKLATKSAKPLGVYEVKKGEIESYIKNIEIKEFPGIGKAFQKRLYSYEIYKLGDIKERKELFYSWKLPGIQLYNRVLGIDKEGINKAKDRKSIGISRTFDPIKDRYEIKRRISILARHIVYMVYKQKVNPTTYYLKINYDYGFRIKHSIKVERVFSEILFKDTMSELFDMIDTTRGHITKISMNVSNFSCQKLKTLDLINHNDDLKRDKISKSLHKLREKYSLDIIKSGSEL
jgi:DNA polymerase-4